MRKVFFILLLLPLFAIAQPSPQEVQKWEQQAKRVTIIQDDWGIPHIYGKSDADAVFGLLYVQSVQNFPRIERNYLEMMGRLSEVDGESKIYDDLQMQLLYESAGAKADYKAAPLWLKKLLDAFADGINFYLYKHPEVKPLVLKKFEPWFPLMYTDGSISPTQTGGLQLQQLRNFYSKENSTSFQTPLPKPEFLEPSGSNGFAIAPSRTASKNAILYINPHVTFYFRTEVHMVSEEGLNAYGAVTWGQFFIYQGFNQYCGWMHTSSYADVADVYEEQMVKQNNAHFYKYDGALKPVRTKPLTLKYKKGNELAEKAFTIYYTHHGPVMGAKGDNWLSLRENNRSMSSLMQSWLRTKAKGLDDFKKLMDMKINNSNNTVFADNKGNIAYWHGNFIPKRDTKYNWKLPVDGSTSATEWKGLHPVSETVHLINPKNGWIQNCNSTPFTAAGSSSPKKENYPAYMAPDGQNGRALNAIRLLSNATNVTLDKIIAIGYDTYLSAFDYILPSLFKAYEATEPTNKLKKQLEEPVHLLKKWDQYASASSIATTLGVEWAYKLAARVPPSAIREDATNIVTQFTGMAALPAADQLQLLADVMNDLEKNWGTWRVAWGDINRYQRTTDGKFEDQKMSLPVGLGPGNFGSLPSYAARYVNTKKRYGVSGNSFVAAVEFGKKIKARTIMTGGESFDPASKHFMDQASGFIEGKFKDIYFYKEDVLKHKVVEYKPGAEKTIQ